MSFPRYPKYKDSGVEWLGEVPEHWKIIPLKWLTDPGRPIMYGIVLPGPDVGEGIPILKGGNVKPSRMNLQSMARTTPEIEAPYARARLKEGDLVYSIRGSIGDCEPVPEELEGSNITQDVARVAIACGVCAHWARWALLASAIRDDLACGSLGAAVRGINIFDLKRANIPTPPPGEQSAIAEFLNRETVKIDELVCEQRRLIELLKKKRQAVISHAVTKGLNPRAPMKPSGIEWLGDVPEHWEVKRLSPLSTKITNGYVGPTRDILTNDGVRYLQSLHIKENEIRFDSPYFVSEEWSNQHSKSVLETGDVLIVQTGDIGQVTVVTEEFAGCNCHALIIVAPVRSVVNGEWISWVLNSDYGLHSLLSIQTGALHPHLNCGDVKDISIPLPRIAEQQRIVAYIADQVGAFDTLTAEAQRAIDLLQERRTALISAAVTGQIDVRPRNGKKSA